MKISGIPELSVKSVAIALIATHALPLLFVVYADTFLNQWLPSLFVVLIPLFFLLYRSVEGVSDFSFMRSVLKIIGLAACSALALFLIGYFSANFQPPIQEAKISVGWVVLPGAENMAFVLRLFLQTWLFSLVCVMAARWLKQSPHGSGFLSRFYPERELLPWIMDVVAIGATLILLTIVVVFASQQLFYLISRLLGLNDLFSFPQLSIFVFLFSLFVMNKACGFSKRILAYAKQPNAHMALIYLAFIVFMCMVWVFSQFALRGLPDGTQIELAQALNIGFASLESFARYWPLMMISCSFYLVVPLTVMLSRLLASGSRVLLSVAIATPIAIAAFFITLFPSINAAFWAWTPHLHFASVPITDAIVQFRFNGFSILLLGMLILLLSCMGSGTLFMKTMLSLTPNTLGRRERRVRENVTQLFKLLCMTYAIFGVLGIYGLALNTAIYLLTVLTACGILIMLGMHQRFQQLRQKPAPIKVCMEVK